MLVLALQTWAGLLLSLFYISSFLSLFLCFLLSLCFLASSSFVWSVLVFVSLVCPSLLFMVHFL